MLEKVCAAWMLRSSLHGCIHGVFCKRYLILADKSGNKFQTVTKVRCHSINIPIKTRKHIMKPITVYTANLCPYCTMAKRLLDKKGATYTEINVDSQPGLRQEMMEKTRRRTVPQIYIGDLHVGGFDDLYALEVKNELDTLLN